MSRQATARVQPQSESHNRPDPDSREHQDQAAAQQSSASVHPVEPSTNGPNEPEDARVTGTSRSLQRRVLGLNVDGGQAQQHPDTPAGQHATGSFPKDPGGSRQK